MTVTSEQVSGSAQRGHDLTVSLGLGESFTRISQVHGSDVMIVSVVPVLPCDYLSEWGGPPKTQGVHIPDLCFRGLQGFEADPSVVRGIPGYPVCSGETDALSQHTGRSCAGVGATDGHR